MHSKIKNHISKAGERVSGLGEFWGIKVVLLAIVFSSGVFSGKYILPAATASAQDVNFSMGTIKIEVSPEMKLYEQVKKILDDKYIKGPEIKEDTKAYGSIKGLVESYGDPYTVFFPPVQSKQFKAVVSGTFSGVGMEVGIKDNVLTVVSPLKKSPAEKAGIKPDDKILKINGTSTEGMATDVAVNLIRGEKGTPVTITIFRKSEEKARDITIIRDTIDVPVVETQNLKDTFVISIASFSETSAQKFQEALQEFATSKKKNLVIDLRNNPGGYLEAAVLMSSFFFPADKLIVAEDFIRTGKQNVHNSKGFNSIPADVKIVILVNKGSASASEIFAGAFQDYGRAKIVGEQSFGKGSVQEYMDLPDGTSLKVTVAHWLTPYKHMINGLGITPDITVTLKEAKVKGKIDNQLEAAIKILGDWKSYDKYSALGKTQYDFDKKALVPTVAVSATTSPTTVQIKSNN
jgi:carboxyl-terminal processing protease